VRAILLDPQSAGMDAMTELLLYAASRRQHTVEVIRPALAGGQVVLCDRYTDSTLAYQGFGRLLDLDQLRTLNGWATGRLVPDLTLLFDLPEEVGLTRARVRNDSDHALQSEARFEAEEMRFHRRVREGYRTLALAEPQRYVTVDGDGSVDEVFARTLAALATRAPRLLA
jgi:dTMP kinase